MKKIFLILAALSLSFSEINEFEAAFNKQLQKQLSSALEENGFVDVGGNEYVASNSYETTTFKFNEIKAVQGGVGLFNPIFTYESEYTKNHFQFDLIKISIPISQFIDNLEQLKNGEMLDEINSFTVALSGMNLSVLDKARNEWIEPEDYYDENWNDRWDEWEEYYDANNNGKRDDGYWLENNVPNFLVDASMDELLFIFTGQLTQEIFENLEYGVIPHNNQVVELSIKGFQYDNLIMNGVDGFDLYKSFDNVKDLFTMDNLKIKFGFLPENNKLRFLVNMSSPMSSADCEFSSNIQFNHNDFMLSNFGQVEGHIRGDYNIPFNTSLDLDKYMEMLGALYGIKTNLNEVKYGEITLPSNSSAQGSFYSSDLLNFIVNSELNQDPNPYLLKNLLSSLRFNYDIAMSRFGYNFTNTMIPQELNLSFNEFNIDNFKFKADINNGNALLNINIPTNIFNFSFNSNIDFMSMFPYNMDTLKDLRLPVIKSTEIRLSKIHPDLEQFITKIEDDMGEKFPRRYGDIVLNVSGTLDNPTIQGMNFPNQQPQQTKY